VLADFNEATLASAAFLLGPESSFVTGADLLIGGGVIAALSTNYAEPSVADYDDRRGAMVEYWKSQNGRQSGDPAKLARALIKIASQEPPPRRFIAGADAIATTEEKIADLKAQIARTGTRAGQPISAQAFSKTRTSCLHAP
jgi:hypothetical protein